MPDRPDTTEHTTVISHGLIDAAVAALEESGHFLVQVSGDGPLHPIAVGPVPVTIGRDHRRTVTIHDLDLSRFHCQVTLVDGQVVVEDMGSTNGTFVNDERVLPTTHRRLIPGDLVRMGRQHFRYERASRRDLQRTADFADDIRRAREYVAALLPEPITDGPIRTTWHYEPSAQLGGDAFGYRWLDDHRFAFYLLDVSGHGAGSAMHSVTVLNLLRQQGLEDVDAGDPASVLHALNARFPLEQHGGLFFTMWYGVYDTRDRSLVHGAAGHHPAFLVDAARTAAAPLGTSALMIGGMSGTPYTSARATVPVGGSIYLFSDGAFEVETRAGGMWGLQDLERLVTGPPQAGVSEATRLYRAVLEASIRPTLADDFSMLVLTFE